MLDYKYTARDPVTGKRVEGDMQAASEKAVADSVKSQGLALLDVSIDTQGGLFKFGRKRIKSKDKVIFSRQLSTLIDAGLPLVQSLRSVLEQTDNKSMQVVLNRIITDVEGGQSFSVSLEKHPKGFRQSFYKFSRSR